MKLGAEILMTHIISVRRPVMVKCIVSVALHVRRRNKARTTNTVESFIKFSSNTSKGWVRCRKHATPTCIDVGSVSTRTMIPVVFRHHIS